MKKLCILILVFFVTQGQSFGTEDESLNSSYLSSKLQKRLFVLEVEARSLESNLSSEGDLEHFEYDLFKIRRMINFLMDRLVDLESSDIEVKKSLQSNLEKNINLLEKMINKLWYVHSLNFCQGEGYESCR
ncbi:MAG: hypothetical protein CME65_01820 [Halobacteriovoraceae bacterium]|nr:hypothetical protein [Halobacteriovoraceae bacterium]